MLIWKKHFLEGGVVIVNRHGVLIKDSLKDTQPVHAWRGHPLGVWVVSDTGRRLVSIADGLVFEVKKLALCQFFGDYEFHITQRM